MDSQKKFNIPANFFKVSFLTLKNLILLRESKAEKGVTKFCLRVQLEAI